MREKIQIGIGQCGVNISSQFCKMITKEHGLDLEGFYIGDNDDQLKSINCYFNETSKQNYVPRSFLIDLDSRSIDSVMCGECSKLFSEESYISGLNGSSGNWGQAYYISGKDLQDFIMDFLSYLPLI